MIKHKPEHTVLSVYPGKDLSFDKRLRLGESVRNESSHVTPDLAQEKGETINPKLLPLTFVFFMTLYLVSCPRSGSLNRIYSLFVL